MEYYIPSALMIIALWIAVAYIFFGIWLFIGLAFITLAWLCTHIIRSRRRKRSAVLARAEQQHAWVLDGDPRGTYGELCHMLQVDGSWYSREEAVKRLSGEWDAGKTEEWTDSFTYEWIRG